MKISSVADPDPNPDPDPHVLGLPDLELYPLVRGMDPNPDPDLDPSIIICKNSKKILVSY